MYTNLWRGPTCQMKTITRAWITLTPYETTIDLKISGGVHGFKIIGLGFGLKNTKGPISEFPSLHQCLEFEFR